ncbi:MAG TPA: hypothetical protein VNF73_10670 [Candidatus Saccharimonadales bacterium]|nr:hypothetical protein [Candidatus Saccharimonadales bacterium]
MSSLFLIDVLAGATGVVGGWWIRRRADRRPPADPDDEVALADVGSAVRAWGAAVLLAGLLGQSGLPGGFDLPVWSVAGLGLGATGAALVALRAHLEGWEFRRPAVGLDRPHVESETWQYGLIGAFVAAGLTYFVGLVVGTMQPVHLVVALLEGTVGYALGLVVWTPRTKIRRSPMAESEAAGPSSTPQRRARRGRALRRQRLRRGRAAEASHARIGARR